MIFIGFCFIFLFRFSYRFCLLFAWCLFVLSLLFVWFCSFFLPQLLLFSDVLCIVWWCCWCWCQCRCHELFFFYIERAALCLFSSYVGQIVNYTIQREHPTNVLGVHTLRCDFSRYNWRFFFSFCSQSFVWLFQTISWQALYTNVNDSIIFILYAFFEKKKFNSVFLRRRRLRFGCIMHVLILCRIIWIQCVLFFGKSIIQYKSRYKLCLVLFFYSFFNIFCVCVWLTFCCCCCCGCRWCCCIEPGLRCVYLNFSVCFRYSMCLCVLILFLSTDSYIC